MKLDLKFTENNREFKLDFGQFQDLTDVGYERGYEAGYKKGYEDGLHAKGMTMLYNWDFTQSLVDAVEGVEAQTNATHDSNGVALSAENTYIKLTPNGKQDFHNKIFDIDVASCSLKSVPTHLRMFGIATKDANTAANAMVFIWRCNTVKGWTWYAGTWGDTQLSTTDYPLNFFSGKTVRLEFDSNGYVTLSYATIGSSNFTKIVTFAKPCTYENGNWVIGSSENSKMNGFVFSGVRVYQTKYEQ